VQADSLVEFLDEFQRNETVQPLIKSAPDPLSAGSALRVATWALALGIPGSALGRRLPGIVESATDAFGPRGTARTKRQATIVIALRADSFGDAGGVLDDALQRARERADIEIDSIQLGTPASAGP
jgi:hypothetical protein